ncbi:hypothetical protein, partial [Limnofasciculus baicalensis]|uniref:hypothetical protein n=1 Tax=Limnofasciculus baicalensis TaxID=3064906 RepID=UPI00403A29EE
FLYLSPRYDRGQEKNHSECSYANEYAVFIEIWLNFGNRLVFQRERQVVTVSFFGNCSPANTAKLIDL